MKSARNLVRWRALNFDSSSSRFFSTWKSNRIKYKEDFETMDDEMKAAAEVGRLAATKEAPAPAPAATGDPMTDD